MEEMGSFQSPYPDIWRSRPLAPNQSDSISGEYRFRVLVMGAPGVGKSTIISQFLYGCPPHLVQQDGEEKVMLVEGHEDDMELAAVQTGVPEACSLQYKVGDWIVTLELQELPYHATGDHQWRSHVASGDAFVIVYSVDNEWSQGALSGLREELEKQHAFLHIPIVIVANKMDMHDGSRHVQIVTTEMEVVEDWGNGYAATTATIAPESLTSIFLQILPQMQFAPDRVMMERWLALHTTRDPAPRERFGTFTRLSRRFRKMVVDLGGCF